MSLGGHLFPEGRRRIRQRLIAETGGYLSNVVRSHQVTCTVCAKPVLRGYALCWRCQRDREEFGNELADLVLPLCYGIKGSQSGHLMHSYKDLAAPARHNQTLLGLLLLAALDCHGACIERYLDTGIDVWATVPSVRADRTGEHPLHVVCKRRKWIYPRWNSHPASYRHQRHAAHAATDSFCARATTCGSDTSC